MKLSVGSYYTIMDSHVFFSRKFIEERKERGRKTDVGRVFKIGPADLATFTNGEIYSVIREEYLKPATRKQIARYKKERSLQS